MPRAKNRVASRAKRKKLLSQTKGYYGKRGSCITVAKDTFLRGGVYAFRDRKQNKRNFRTLWIMRINAAARQHGIAYGKFISGLKTKGIELDRKSLAHIALHEPDTFKKLVETVTAIATA
jgi:large subunit ribosomal protein L20